VKTALSLLVLLLLAQICSGVALAYALGTFACSDPGTRLGSDFVAGGLTAFPETSSESGPVSLLKGLTKGDLKALESLASGSGIEPGYSVAQYDDMMDFASWNGESEEEDEGDKGSLSIIRIDPVSFPKILVYLLVRQGCPSENLSARSFAIKENGSSQTVGRLFSTGRDENQSLDLAVVFDDTKSMEDQIDGMKAGVQRLINQIDSIGLNTRYSLVTFKDGVTIRCNWTNDTTAFNNAVGSLYASGGDEIHEDTLDATEAALSMGFRNDTIRTVIVVTDAPSHQKGDGTNISNYTRDEVKNDLIKSDVMFISVSPDFSSSPETVDLRYLAEDAGGAWIDLRSSNFSAILERILSILTQTYSVEYWTNDLAPNTTRTVLLDAKSVCLRASDSENYTSPPDLNDQENILLVYDTSEAED
jgi:hypothetical protein